MRVSRTKKSVLGALAALGALSVSASASAQLFVDQGATKLGTQPCGGAGCWTNYARVTDYDGDGDLDLVAPNSQGLFTPPNEAQPLVLYKNDGAGNFTLSSSDFGNLTGAVRQVALGDFDGDGDLDVYVPADSHYQPDALFIKGAGGFVNEASTRLPAGLSSDAGFARAGDFDGDGDLDLIVGDGYLDSSSVPAHLYLNDGTGKFAEAPSGTLPTAKPGVNPNDVDLVDVDGDFDLDVYINFHNGQNALWINDGTGKFTDASSTLPAIPGSALHYGPVLCDIDGDGDRDLMIENTADNYEEQILINDGTGHFTDETAERMTGNVGSDDNLLVCVDYDGDGDFDLAVGALSTKERLFQNDGTGHFTAVANAFDGPTNSTLWMEFGDLNGDGRLDLFTAQGEGGSGIERIYFGSAGISVDTRAPTIVAVEEVAVSPGAVVRFAVSDSSTTDQGPRLKRAYLKLGTDEVDATFMGGDLFRAVMPAASATTYQVCAVDLRDNEACADAGSTTTTSTTNATGAGGSAGPGGDQTGHTSAGSGGAGGGGSADDGSGDGCGCSLPGDASSFHYGVFALAGLGLAAGARRARGRKPTATRGSQRPTPRLPSTSGRR